MKGLLMIGIVCAMLLFGCAAQANPPSQPQSPPAASGQQPPAGSNQQPANQQPANANPAGVQNEPPAAQPAESASDALLAALRASSGYKAVYDVTAGNATYEMTQYLKGGNSRTDVATGGMQIRMYDVSKKTSTCILAGTKWTCTSTTSQAGNQTSDLSQQLQSEEAKYTVTADGIETFAGTAAACYKIVSSDGTNRYCVSPEGVPLYLKSSAGDGDIVMEATSYSTSVADSDFALPA